MAVAARALAPDARLLGEVHETGSLQGPLQQACAGTGPLRLSLSGSGVFGRGGPVWVGVAGDTGRLAGLADRVASACRRAGLDVERRPYRPHLTVGRRGHPDPRLLASYAGPSWAATEVELVRSRVGRTVHHEVVERFSL